MSSQAPHHHHEVTRPGQSLVELALTLPILVLLLMGLIELGLILYAHVQVANAAREGARAASLYRSARFTSGMESNGNVPTCDGIDGWTLQQTVNQAIVYHDLQNGCPDPSKAIVYTSLGRLNPTPPVAWQASVTATLGSDGMPTAGAQGTVTLIYPYQLVILSNVLPFLNDPIWIRKTVQFEFHQ